MFFEHVRPAAVHALRHPRAPPELPPDAITRGPQCTTGEGGGQEGLVRMALSFAAHNLGPLVPTFQYDD